MLAAGILVVVAGAILWGKRTNQVFWHVRHRNYHQVEDYLRRGGDPDAVMQRGGWQTKECLLTIAVRNRDYKMISLLKQHGADSCLEMAGCGTPLGLAIGMDEIDEESHHRILEELLGGADLTKGVDGETQLHIAARFCDTKAYEMFKTNPTYSRAREMRDYNGKTPDEIRLDARK